MDVGITKMSSKGQVVIPLGMRKDFKKGEKVVVIKNKNQIILEKISFFNKKLEEDLEFARRTEEALRRYEKGEFIKMSEEDFLKKLKSW